MATKKISEIEKVCKWLDKKSIKYKRIINKGIHNEDMRNQILIENDYVKLSIICHIGSYGYEQGLLEEYDFFDEPEGYLTAKQCIEWLKLKLKEVKE